MFTLDGGFMSPRRNCGKKRAPWPLGDCGEPIAIGSGEDMVVLCKKSRRRRVRLCCRQSNRLLVGNIYTAKGNDRLHTRACTYTAVPACNDCVDTEQRRCVFCLEKSKRDA